MKSKTLKFFILAALIFNAASVSYAESKYSIKEMTPKVKAALDGRKERFEMIRTLKDEGAVGETHRGYLKALREGGKVKAVVEKENQNRKVIYQAIVDQNDLQGALETVEHIFGQKQKERSEDGDFIELDDGSWVQK